MENQLTQEKIERIKQEKIKKFKSMGLPISAGQIADIPLEQDVSYEIEKGAQMLSEGHNYEGNVLEQFNQQLEQERLLRNNRPQGNSDKLSLLQSIKSGAKKQDFRQIDNKEKANSFSELKVPKRKNPNENVKKVDVKKFNAQPIPGFGNIESLFDDTSSSSMPSNTNINIQDNNYDIGPSIDIENQLKQRLNDKVKKQQNTNQNISENAYTNDTNQIIDIVNAVLEKNNSHNLEFIKEIAKTTAKNVSENIIKSVLSEYLDKQKKQNTFEIVSKEKNIIKIGDSYFKLSQVSIKK